jgi:hypothetical protein
MIYLASPYTHPDARVREARFEQACRAAAALIRAGVAVFSPVAHSHPIAHFGVPTTWEYWSHIDREYLARSEVLAILTLPGWRESVGVTAEMEMALELQIPIVYISPADLDAADEGPTLSELEHTAHAHGNLSGR